VAFIGTTNVVDYFEWQNLPGTQAARMPGIATCEFGLWRGMAQSAAAEGEGSFLDPAEFDVRRRELDCSEVVREWLGPPPEPAPEAPP
jgi:hypothetical protein